MYIVNNAKVDDRFLVFTRLGRLRELLLQLLVFRDEQGAFATQLLDGLGILSDLALEQASFLLDVGVG